MDFSTNAEKSFSLIPWFLRFRPGFDETDKWKELEMHPWRSDILNDASIFDRFDLLILIKHIQMGD